MGFSVTEYYNRFGYYPSAGAQAQYTSRGRQAFRTPGQSVSIKTNAEELFGVIDGYEEQVLQAIRPAAQAGAQVFYEAAIRNVVANGQKTGNLADAIYQAYSKNQSTESKAVYHVSWNGRKAPHGGLVEFGHIQRYAAHFGDDGKWYTVVRPSMRGKPKPGRSASQATKDAYYVLRKGGPQQIAAQPFMRTAFSRREQAYAAVRTTFFKEMGTNK